VDNSQTNIIISVNQKNPRGDCDIFVKVGSAPSRYNFDYRDVSVRQLVQLLIGGLVNSKLYIGINGWSGSTEDVEYELVVYQNKSCPLGCSNHGTCLVQGVCQCKQGWFGTSCNTLGSILESGVPVSSNISSENEWQYFYMNSTSTTVFVTMKELGPESDYIGVLYLYISEDNTPTLRNFDYYDIDLNKGFHSIEINLDDRPNETISWIIGVYGSPYLTGPVGFKLVYWEPPN